MIEIDGAAGGGQILRTSIALSSILNEPIRVFNIRGGKEKTTPGLKAQHLTGIEVMKTFTNGHANGLKEGSMEVEFFPKRLELNDAKINVGTAGSVPLLLQTLTPALVFGDRKVELEITGGTETMWAPTIQYFQNVTLGVLRKMGTDVSIEVKKHGYYPKGGGVVNVKSKPTKLRPIRLLNRGELIGVHIESVSGSFPEEVARRQAEAALGVLKYHIPAGKISVSYKKVDSISPGTSITCYAIFENTVLGGSSLGGRGVMAENVGIAAADDLVHSLKTNACLDRYMADQILPFMALAKGESDVSVREVTEHCMTNIKAIEKMLPVKFRVTQGEGESRIWVKGVG